MFAILISHKDLSSFAGEAVPVRMSDATVAAGAYAMALSDPPMPYAGGAFGDSFVYVAM